MGFFNAHISVSTPASTMGHIKYIKREGKYSNVDDLVYEEYGNLPQWAKDEKDYWQTVVDHELQREEDIKNGIKAEKNYSCRQYKFALPNEMTKEEMITFTQEYLQENFTDYPYSFVIHEKESTVHGILNPHVHLIFTDYQKSERTDQLDRETYFKKHGISKAGREYGGAARNREYSRRPPLKYRQARKDLADRINAWYKEKGIDKTVSEKTLKEQQKECLNNCEFAKAETLKRKKPIRLKLQKFKKNQKIIQEKVKAGWENAGDLSDVLDPEVKDRILQEFEKQNSEKMMAIIKEREKEYSPSDIDKLNAIKMQLEEIQIINNSAPKRKSYMEELITKKEKELEKQKDTLTLSITAQDSENYFLMQKYKAELTEEIHNQYMNYFNQCDTEEQIKEAATVTYMQKQMRKQAAKLHKNKISPSKNKSKKEKASQVKEGDPAYEKQKKKAYEIKKFISALNYQFKKLGIDAEFQEKNKEEIQDYVQKLNRLDVYHISEKNTENTKKQNEKLNDTVLEQLDQFKRLLSREENRTWDNVALIAESVYGKTNTEDPEAKKKYIEATVAKWKTERAIALAELKKLKAQLENARKEEDLNISIQKKLNARLRRADERIENIELRKFTNQYEEKRIKTINKKTMEKTAAYVEHFEAAMPHSSRYYAEQIMNKEENNKIQKMKETLRKLEKEKRFTLKAEPEADTSGIDYKINSLKEEIQEEYYEKITPEILVKAEEMKQKSTKIFDENRQKLIAERDHLFRQAKDKHLEQKTKRKIERARVYSERTLSREKLITDTVQKRIEAFETKLLHSIPRTGSYYIEEIINEKTGNALKEKDKNIRATKRIIETLKDKCPEKTQQIAELEKILKSKVKEREKYVSDNTKSSTIKEAKKRQTETLKTKKYMLKELKIEYKTIERHNNSKHIPPTVAERNKKHLKQLYDLMKTADKEYKQYEKNYSVDLTDTAESLMDKVDNIAGRTTGRANIRVSNERE